jgi:hypothetical protein
VAADTPEETLAKSAAVQLGGSAAAVVVTPESIAQAIAPVPIPPAIARCIERAENNMAGSFIVD